MMHAIDADAPHARSTDAPPTHKACTAARISPPTSHMHLERASGSKRAENDSPETARATAQTATTRAAAHLDGGQARRAHRPAPAQHGYGLGKGGARARTEEEGQQAKDRAVPSRTS